MVRRSSTGDAARATGSRAGAAGHRPIVPRRRRPPGPPRFAEAPEPLECLEPRRLLATFTVTTTADDGPGSLRQAILDANVLSGTDEIHFDLAGDGVRTISVVSALPEVTDPVTIDATTQPGYEGSPRVALDGTEAPDGADGFVIRATATVRGLAVTGFPNRGVAFLAGSGSVLDGCYVGQIPGANSLEYGNRGRAGVVVSAPNTVIGGADPAGRNIISGNSGIGVWVNGSFGAVIRNAYIGLAANGTTIRPNGKEGILVEAARGARIGSPTGDVRTVVSSNYASGIRLAADAADVVISGTYVGTNAAGDAPRPNGRLSASTYRDGITTAGSDVRIVGGFRSRNVISANPGAGIAVIGGTAQILGNYIGTDATGSAPLSNDYFNRQANGVRIAGGTNVRLGDYGTYVNVISGNAGSGVRIEGVRDTPSSVWIMGNYIGTDATGTRAVPNGGDGVTVDVSGTGQVVIGEQANVMSGNTGAGIRVNGTMSTAIRGARVGTNAAGTAAVPNGDGIVVSGGHPDILNSVISGNIGAGIRALNTGVPTIGSNLIGTDPQGVQAIPNRGNGVEVLDTVAVLGRYGRDGNVISGNLGHGVLVAGTRASASLSANVIGTSRGGYSPLGNRGSGVYIAGGRASIGSPTQVTSTTDNGNVISANGGNGITIADFFGTPATGVSVFNNAIGTNGARSLDVPGFGNAGHGVAIVNSSRNQIGMADPPGSWKYSNTIAFNGASGVSVQQSALAPSSPADGNRIQSNFIFANGGLGIDLGGDGVTPNDALDADAGPNALQNFPVLQDGVVAASRTAPVSIGYTLDSEPNRDYSIEFFASPEPDASGYGEGRKLVSSSTVRTNAAGHAAGVVTLIGVAGSYLSATATGPGGTSEFSPAAHVVGPEVVGRSVFYNNSAFDGHDPAATSADDGAVATDKRGLRPWEPATFANVTGYDKGINGVMIDVARLPAGATLTPDDFAFRSYRPAQNPDGVIIGFPWRGGWVAAPAPSSITVRRGAGVGGSDRVTLVWPDRGRIASSAAAVFNRWLEITVRANARTGLTQPDVFYFGNLVGETGDGVTPASTELEVGAPDLAGTRRALSGPAPVTSAYDHNRDGAVNALDMAIVRRNLGQRLTLKPSPVGLPSPSNPNTGPVIFATTAAIGAELREPDTDGGATALLRA